MNFKQFVFSIFLFFVFLLTPLTIIESLEWDGYIEFLSGYCKDELSCTVNAFDNPDVFGTDTTLLSTDHLKARDLNIFENGYKAEVIVCGWFVRSWGTLGNVKNGRYIDRIHLPGTAKNTDTVIKAHVFQGKTYDLSVSLGYIFPIWGCEEDDCIYISAAPMAGYSWNRQNIEMNKATINNVPFSILDGLTYKNDWRGPWIGLEIDFENPWIEIIGGYEYHWPHWRGEWLLAGPDVPGVAFSDRRHSHVYFGSNAYVEARYYLLKGWYIDSLIDFRYWRSKKGQLVPRAGSFSEVGIPDTQEDRVSRAIWKSFAIQLSMGYYF